MLYDISPPITENLAVWPGDTPPSREVLLDLKKGDPITLSTLRATVHLGAHVDGPNHYGVDAPGVTDRDLSAYLGPCQVVHVAVERGTRVGMSALTGPITEERVLLRTASFPDPNRFDANFAAIDPDLVTALNHLGVCLIGIDTPSVDLFDSKDLPAHRRFLDHDIAILEGIRLEEVPEGRYELIALPLPLVGFDASPVRAVLREITPPTQ